MSSKKIFAVLFAVIAAIFMGTSVFAAEVVNEVNMTFDIASFTCLKPGTYRERGSNAVKRAAWDKK